MTPPTYLWYYWTRVLSHGKAVGLNPEVSNNVRYHMRQSEGASVSGSITSLAVPGFSLSEQRHKMPVEQHCPAFSLLTGHTCLQIPNRSQLRHTGGQEAGQPARPRWSGSTTAQAPQFLILTGSFMYPLLFSTDNSRSSVGFLIRYESKWSPCQGPALLPGGTEHESHWVTWQEACWFPFLSTLHCVILRTFCEGQSAFMIFNSQLKRRHSDLL